MIQRLVTQALRQPGMIALLTLALIEIGRAHV